MSGSEGLYLHMVIQIAFKIKSMLLFEVLIFALEGYFSKNRPNAVGSDFPEKTYEGRRLLALRGGGWMSNFQEKTLQWPLCCGCIDAVLIYRCTHYQH